MSSAQSRLPCRPAQAGQGLLEFLLVLTAILTGILGILGGPFSRSVTDLFKESGEAVIGASSAFGRSVAPWANDREQELAKRTPASPGAKKNEGTPKSGSSTGSGSSGLGTEGGGAGGGGGGGGTSGGTSGAGGSGGGAGGAQPLPLAGFSTPLDAATAIQDVLTALADEGAGSLAKETADFLTLHQVTMVFESLDAGEGGFVDPNDPTTIHLNQAILTQGWEIAEIAALVAHEAYHVKQIVVDHLLAQIPVFLLEDVEGPAYVRETLVWNELRRDASGNVTKTSIHNDLDFRANTFIISGETVDIAKHNEHISQTRGIPPNTPYQ